MILKEGGNIFKDEQGTPVTQRINRDSVDPTLLWLEKNSLQKTFNETLSFVCKEYNNNIDINIKPNTPQNPTTTMFLEDLKKQSTREGFLKRTLVGPHTDKYSIVFNLVFIYYHSYYEAAAKYLLQL